MHSIVVFVVHSIVVFVAHSMVTFVVHSTVVFVVHSIVTLVSDTMNDIPFSELLNRHCLLVGNFLAFKILKKNRKKFFRRHTVVLTRKS